MKARRQPFSVHLRWAAPEAMAKQEVCYVAGRHDGQMRVRPAGLVGSLGFVSINPNDPRARAHSSHTITEAGVGPLTERVGRDWEAARHRPAQVHVADAEFDGRPCRRVEVVMTEAPAGRTVVFFDRETHLPIRAEWYERGRDGEELREVDSYTKMRRNVGLVDADFEY
jgi:hypothetical protein